MLQFAKSTNKEIVFSTIKEFMTSQGFVIANEDAFRPWGGFLVIDEAQAPQFIATFFPQFSLKDFEGFDKLSPKILLVAPHQRFSWQYHHRRSEIWTVIGGNPGIVRSETDEQNV